jgi:hypothetical protein
MKLAEALLRRKELEAKVSQLKQIKEKDVFEVKGKRVKVAEDVDDLILSVPKITIAQVTEEYDFYAQRLRLLDAAIQQCNWTVDVTVDGKVWNDYTPNKQAA